MIYAVIPVSKIRLCKTSCCFVVVLIVERRQQQQKKKRTQRKGIKVEIGTSLMLSLYSSAVCPFFYSHQRQRRWWHSIRYSTSQTNKRSQLRKFHQTPSQPEKRIMYVCFILIDDYPLGACISFEMCLMLMLHDDMKSGIALVIYKSLLGVLLWNNIYC